MFPAHTGSVSLLLIQLPPPSWPYSRIPLPLLSSSVDSILISPSQYIPKCFHNLPVHLPPLHFLPPDLPSRCRSDNRSLSSLLALSACFCGLQLKTLATSASHWKATLTLLSFTLAPVQLITSVYPHTVKKRKPDTINSIFFPLSRTHASKLASPLNCRRQGTERLVKSITIWYFHVLYIFMCLHRVNLCYSSENHTEHMHMSMRCGHSALSLHNHHHEPCQINKEWLDGRQGADHMQKKLKVKSCCYF